MSIKKWRCLICNEVFDGDTPPQVCPVCGAGADAFEEVITKAPAVAESKEGKYVIIGGGVSAIECAKAIRSRNPLCKITMLCEEGILPYNRPALSDVLEDGSSLKSITLQEKAWFDENKIDVILNNPAKEVDRYGKIVYLKNGDFLPYDKLAMATGAKAFCPFKSEEGNIPVYTLRTYEDVKNIDEKVKLSKECVVVGGGILGLEAAIALLNRGLKVTVVEIAEQIISAQADKYASQIIQDRLSRKGLEIITSTSVVDINTDGIILKDGTEIKADFVLVSAGIRSNISLAEKCSLTVNRGIIVNDKMKTNDQYIYAMGDCAEYNGRVTGLWSTASVQGELAGASMVGDEAIYNPLPPATAFEGADISLFSVGNVRAEAAKEITSCDNDNYKNLVFQNGKLVGVVLLGDTSLSAKAIKAVSQAVSEEEAVKTL